MAEGGLEWSLLAVLEDDLEIGLLASPTRSLASEPEEVDTELVNGRGWGLRRGEECAYTMHVHAHVSVVLSIWTARPAIFAFLWLH